MSLNLEVHTTVLLIRATSRAPVPASVHAFVPLNKDLYNSPSTNNNRYLICEHHILLSREEQLQTGKTSHHKTSVTLQSGAVTEKGNKSLFYSIPAKSLTAASKAASWRSVGFELQQKTTATIWTWAALQGKDPNKYKRHKYSHYTFS